MGELPQPQSEESIQKKARQARQKLQDLIIHLKKTDQTGGSCDHGLSPLAVTDVLERFVLWAGNLGAFHGPTARLSLDYRLSENPEVRDEILTQLGDICEATDDLLDIILGNRENRDLASSLVSEEDLTDRDEVHMILEVISDSVSSLFRIAILVRRATTRDRFERALQASDLAFPPEFDIDYVREKHPKIQQRSLSARLGGAIAKRRQLISYCRDHRSRLGAEQTINDDSASRMEKTSSKATTFVPRADLWDLEAEQDDAVSFTSASTMTDSALLFRLPSLADLSPDGNPFECPICFTLQAFRRDKAWKKHAFRDLKAYVCTLGGRECDGLLFGDRDSCARRVSKRSLRSHFATHGTFTDQQLHILEDAARNTGITLRARDCPFCDEWDDKLRARSVTPTPGDQGVVVSHVRFKRHVATHQEQLAIFALPRAIEEDETLDKELALNSNSDSESMRGSTDDEHGQHPLHHEEPYTDQLQEPGANGPPTTEPKDLENELQKVGGLSSLETIYDSDSDSNGPDMRPPFLSRLKRAMMWNFRDSQVPSDPELRMAQASSNVSSSTQEKHECLLCNKEFTRPSSLQTHMHIHKGESFPCHVEGCGQQFFRAWDLHRHLTIHKRGAHFEVGPDDPDGDHSQNHLTGLGGIPSSPTSTIPPGTTSNPLFTSDIQTFPEQQDPEPKSQTPFAIPLHSTPKTYRSQSESVGQVDLETTDVRSANPVLQPPPSRPSMPSELANDGNVPGKATDVEDDDDEKPSGSL
ncbi:hypothetical protein CEP54_010007 [Fusarium duplospermum]|uniref:C2H2-type domain-containing protein n=1 Tax=Fusarium duplospermum TaxID=1325734 RepID=A0A428PMH7_9HYPO|nr:hypothetical protein CEP54_010007 [Fusarium duplospermum]